MPASNTLMRPLFRQCGALKHNLIGLVLVSAGLVLMVWAALPPSYNTDLSLIGQGKPTVVLVFDNENVASSTLMEGFNKVRDDYEGMVEFLVADINTDMGELFAFRNQVNSASAIYFNGNGERVLAFHGPQDEAVLHDSIRQSFGL